MNRSGGAARCSFAFADQMLDAAATYSLRHRCLRYLNPAVERILGIDRAVLLADPGVLRRVIVEEDWPGVIAFLKQTEQEGSASGEFRIRRQDGLLRWLAVRSFPFEDDGDERLLGAIGEDITERKGIEKALSESEVRFRQVAENIDEVFWITAPDFMQVYYVSPAYVKIWGRPTEELYGAPLKWMQSIHPDDQARVLDTISRFPPDRPHETQFRIFRNGELRHVRHRWAPVRNAEGTVAQMVCMSEDITEQKRLECQAEESARAQREALVREVHHRIKNNLQGVTGMLRNFANQHAEVAVPLNEAIAQVQAVAIIYGLQGRPGAARVMLGDLVTEIIGGVGQLMHSALEFRSDELDLGCAVVVTEMEAVPVALVLNEMIFNAVKHGIPGSSPRIDMKIDIARERVTLTVTNAGLLPGRDQQRTGGGSGLLLIRSLLPQRGAHFDLVDGTDGVEARLTLQPPIVTLKC